MCHRVDPRTLALCPLRCLLPDRPLGLDDDMPTRTTALLLTAVLALWVKVAQADIVVGAPFALTGSVADMAKVMRQGVELAAQHVNKQGGVLGDTYRLAFIDTGCDPDRGVVAVRQLIQSGAVALVGPICSSETLRQARSVSIPAGVVTLSFASASALITELDDQDLVFRTAPSETAKGAAMARQAHALGIRSIAISHASDAYNTGVAQVFAQTFQRLGGQVRVHQTHQPGKDNYLSEARALVGGAEDVALFAYTGSGGLTYLKNLFNTTTVRRVLGTDGLMSKDLAQALDAEHLAKMVFVTAAVNHEREAYKRWQTLATAAGIKADATYVAHAYDAAFLMALAIEAAGAPDKTKIAAGLRAVSGPEGITVYPGEFSKARGLLKQGVRINYDGASGPVDFDRAGDVTGEVSIQQFTRGGWQATLMK